METGVIDTEPNVGHRSSIAKYNSLILKNVYVNGQLLFFRKFKILRESRFNLVDDTAYRKPFPFITFWLVNFIKRKRIKIEKDVVWITDTWSKNYYHWINDCLPRLLSTNRDDLTVLVSSKVYEAPYVKHSLKMLGFDIIVFDNNFEIVKVKRLYLTLPASRISTSNPVFLKELRAVFRPEATNGEAKRIFISRRSATKRKLHNEKQLKEVLFKFNIDVVEMESYSFVEQIGIMKHANLIMGMHGAGLTNMLFMKEYSTVFEFKRPSDDNDCYQNMSLALSFKYHSIETSTTSSEQDQVNGDFMVDVHLLEMKLMSILN